MKTSLALGLPVLAWLGLTCPILATCPDCPESNEPKQPKFNFENNATGDWFGLRNTLEDYGIDVSGGYTTEPRTNAK